MKSDPGFPSPPHPDEKIAATGRRFPKIVGRTFYILREWLIAFWMTCRLLWVRLQHGRTLIVLFRDVGIGDLVCTFPLIAELRKQEPGRLVVYVTLPRFRDFVREFSGADVVIGSRFVHFNRPLPRLPLWAGQVFFPRYANEPKRLGYSIRSNFVTEMAQSCGLSADLLKPSIIVDKKRVAQLAARLGSVLQTRPLIGIHIGPSMPVKEWPLESWRALITLLQGEMGAKVIQLGSAWHHSFDVRSAGKLPVDFDLTDRLTLVETAEFISTIDLFIGIDSGLLHIARAVGTPVIGLFGPTDPAIVLGDRNSGSFTENLPCLFCQHRNLQLHWNTNCPHDIQCMQLLTPEMIFARAEQILAR